MKVLLVIILTLSFDVTIISVSAENPDGTNFRTIGDRECFDYASPFFPNDLSRISLGDLRKTPVSDFPIPVNSNSLLITTLFELEGFNHLNNLFTSNKSKIAPGDYKSSSIGSHISCFLYPLFKIRVISYLSTVVLII